MKEKLIEYMKTEGVSMTHIAGKIGISKQHFNNYLKGNSELSAKTKSRLILFMKEKGIE